MLQDFLADKMRDSAALANTRPGRAWQKRDPLQTTVPQSRYHHQYRRVAWGDGGGEVVRGGGRSDRKQACCAVDTNTKVLWCDVRPQ